MKKKKKRDHILRLSARKKKKRRTIRRGRKRRGKKKRKEPKPTTECQNRMMSTPANIHIAVSRMRVVARAPSSSEKSRLNSLAQCTHGHSTARPSFSLFVFEQADRRHARNCRAINYILSPTQSKPPTVQLSRQNNK